MVLRGLKNGGALVALAVLAGVLVLSSGCGSPGSTSRATPVAPTNALRVVSDAVVSRAGFVGAFFRAEGNPPWGIFSPQATFIAPVPYPTAGAVMTGGAGYCDEVAANGSSIDGAYAVDTQKLNDLIYLGARWSRMGAAQFFIDGSHVFGAGSYSWGMLDAAQCVSLSYHNIRPLIDLEAGPVNYNAIPGTFSPKTFSLYQQPSDFGQWCGAVAQHEKNAFPAVTEYSLPGNEVNSNWGLFPGGETQVAAYARSCYAAIKAVNPSAFVYGFELNMDGSLNAPQFVRDMVSLGCKAGTCYDGLAIHLTLQYPLPPSGTPCFPKAGGAYSIQCVTDIEDAAQAPIHVLVTESQYPMPNIVPDEQTKATAIVSEFEAFAANPTVDGVAYADVDECNFYLGTYFAGGCLIDAWGAALPGYSALQWLAGQSFL